ncbi:hypothetical protein H8B15_13270 [Hymenobacter sp. BT507]|uniref:Uncharacterized protein n=1 Tax=Hymenobacter citatus TaxID=2763506 RepID=A0ABR7MLR3_9BACT|nr:hypothetical protein [Hymenobacter citatus]MBC6611898.1 hypothetical protein [Hymenobacter citatus]
MLPSSDFIPTHPHAPAASSRPEGFAGSCVSLAAAPTRMRMCWGCRM